LNVNIYAAAHELRIGDDFEIYPLSLDDCRRLGIPEEMTSHEKNKLRRLPPLGNSSRDDATRKKQGDKTMKKKEEKGTTKQAYLVVYLHDGQVLANREIVVGVEQARNKCWAYAAPPLEDEHFLATDLDGALSATDGYLREAWAFPIPATVPVTVDDNRPTNEDQIRLCCEFRVCGIRACRWSGLASEAGWDSRYHEWICPECGESEGIREFKAESPDTPDEPPDGWLEAAYEERTGLPDDHA